MSFFSADGKYAVIKVPNKFYRHSDFFLDVHSSLYFSKVEIDMFQLSTFGFLA